MTKLEKAFAENLDAQTKLLEAITKLEEIMAKIFDGSSCEDRCIDNEIEEELMENTCEPLLTAEELIELNRERIEGNRILTKDEGIERIERHEAGEPDAKDIEENNILPDDDEDALKDN
jgi:hypothetical protein